MVSTFAQITLRAAALSINLSQNTSEHSHLKSSRATRLILPSLLKITFDLKKKETISFLVYFPIEYAYVMVSVVRGNVLVISIDTLRFLTL